MTILLGNRCILDIYNFECVERDIEVNILDINALEPTGFRLTS